MSHEYSPAPNGTPSLLIDDRMGTERSILPGETFTVGRDGDLSFRDNPYLHRKLIHLAFHHGLWWISNVGSRIPVKLLDERTGAPSILVSGASDVIVADRLLAVFEAGPTVYEVGVRLTAAPQPPTFVAPNGRDLTAQPGDLNPEQLLLLTAMAEPLLRYPGTGLDRIPSIQAVADRLGWPTTKTNRKLDYLCARLADDGVAGLVGGGKGLAVNRRTRLVEYALHTRLITEKSLRLLDGPEPDTSSF
ncbi:MAG: hypothetical protein QM809_05770 [Gordonia sp. (in: high G+C Gram-positive bacteria)]|uniref:hypothetical protein n=1 Tax=Gordonia sp. (in: high G+C Gram-positive bacteria) TaxID=84139 RepID=UPI0039E2D0BE